MTATAQPAEAEAKPKKPFRYTAEPGLGASTSGTYENRPHYLPAGGPRTLRGSLTESRLRTLRLSAGLTQERLADLTAEIDAAGTEKHHGGAKNPKRPGETVYGVSAYSLTRYENGVHAPRPRYLKLIAEALTQALGRRITTDDLRVQGAGGLATFLEGVRSARGATKAQFYGLLRITDATRVDALLEGRGDWSAEELGRAAVLFPETRQLTQDVLVDQARRADASLAR